MANVDLLISKLDKRLKSLHQEQSTSRWLSQLLEKPDLVPFPITLESNMDLMWFLTPGGKIGLHIGGISEHEFTIGCGQRQLHYFQRFLSDYQTMLASKKQQTSSLFLLRSAKLIWVSIDRSI
jgi:hypothetical protein